MFSVSGYAAFRLAIWLTPTWWGTVTTNSTVFQLMALIALTTIIFAAPPVVIGALAARVAATYEPYVGLAATLWGVGLRLWWPLIPQLPAESWIAPMCLILMSGMIGGWLMSGLNKNRVS